MMSRYSFTSEDKFKGFMFALQQLGIGWEVWDGEGMSYEIKPISEKDFHMFGKHNGDFTINFMEEGISWSRGVVDDE